MLQRSISCSLLIAIFFTLNSCNKCPFNAFFCKQDKSSVTASAFQIIDTRIGTGEFKISDRIAFTFDTINITAVNEEGVSYFWIRADVVVRDSKDAIVMLMPAAIDMNKTVAEKPVAFTHEFSLAGIENLKPGKYTISILATDLIGLHTDIKAIPIKLL